MLLKLIILICTAQLLEAIPDEDHSAVNSNISKDVARRTKVEEIIKYMNATVDPCENYYDFACGNWKTYHLSNASVPWTGVAPMAVENIKSKLINMLTTSDPEEMDAVMKAKNFYKACKSFKSSEADWISISKQIMELTNEFLQMPAIEGDNWHELNFDMLKALGEMNYKYGINPLLGFEIFEDRCNNSIYKVSLSRSPRFSSPNPLDLEKYMGMKKSEALQTSKEINDFEEALDEAISYGPDESSNIDEIQQEYYADLDLKRLLNISMGFITNQTINYYPHIVTALVKLTKETPKRVLANYIYYSFYRQFLQLLPKSGMDLEMYCLFKITEEFDDIASYMFYRSNYKREDIELIKELWKNIKETLQAILESTEVSAIKDKSKKFLLEKLDAMQLILPFYKIDDLNNKYKEFHSYPEDLVENLKSLLTNKATLKRNHLLNGNPQKLMDVNSMILPSQVYEANAVVIPSPLLQNMHMYSEFDPKVLLLSRLGYLLSHEIIKGLNGKGLKYDKMGHCKQDDDADWISDVEFEKQRQCISKQYQNYKHNDVPLNEVTSVDVNSADIGGIWLAYQTYQRLLKNNELNVNELSPDILANFTYTEEQIFFIHYSQLFCVDIYDHKKFNEEALSLSTQQFKAYVPLTNLEGFSRAFKCPTSSVMNPEIKCSVF